MVKRWKSFYRVLSIVEDDKLSRIPQFKRVFIILTTLHLFGAVYLYYRTLGKLDEWADFSNYSWIVSTINCGLLASVIAVYTQGGSKGYEQAMDQQRAYLTSLKLSMASAEEVVNKKLNETSTMRGIANSGGHRRTRSHRFGERTPPSGPSAQSVPAALDLSSPAPASTANSISTSGSGDAAPTTNTSSSIADTPTSASSTGSTSSAGADDDGFPPNARSLCSQIQIMVNSKKRSLIKERMRIVIVLGLVRGLLGIVSAFVDAYLEDDAPHTNSVAAPVAAAAAAATSYIPFQSGVGVIGGALSGALSAIYHATLGLILNHPFLSSIFDAIWNAPSNIDMLFAIPLSTVLSILSDVCILFMLHFIQGLVLFSVSVLLESELHEDLMRWKVFDILASPHRALEQGLPYYIPLSVEFSAPNIAGTSNGGGNAGMGRASVSGGGPKASLFEAHGMSVV